MARTDMDELHRIADEITSEKERKIRAFARRVDAGQAAMPLVWPGGPFSDALARAILDAVPDDARWFFRTDVLESDAEYEASAGRVKTRISDEKLAEKLAETPAGKILLMLEGAGLSVPPSPPQEPPDDAGKLVTASRSAKESGRVDRVRARILYRASVVGAAIEWQSAEEPLCRIARCVADELLASDKGLYRPVLLEVDDETDIDPTAQYMHAHRVAIARFRSILRSAAPGADDALLDALSRDLALLAPVEGDGDDEGWADWLRVRAIAHEVFGFSGFEQLARPLVDAGWIDPTHIPETPGLVDAPIDQPPHLATLSMTESKATVSPGGPSRSASGARSGGDTRER